MKKLISVLLVLLLLSGICVFANDATLPRLVDDGDILTDDEEASLLETLDYISETRECDVVVITMESLGGNSVTSMADAIYDNYGFGYGADDDGILFLISMEEREYATSTYGFGITAFTDYGLDTILGEVVPYLSDGDYYNAFTTFAYLCDEYIYQAQIGEPYDVDNEPTAFDPFWIIIALAVGLVAALIYTGSLKAQLKSVRQENYAANYLRQGSFSLTMQNDSFLTRRVTKVARPRDDDSSGGSSLRSSSSGRMHGGSSGKF